ncbi:hypothetical protein GCM10022225_23320 [Plantactinospora mayteni]|uniref:Uncharacterized protein n=1 Tax=Plantactinospora mayteni TaxID=566021 RepID=A0ABQ4EPD7_9ACTN|nr:hypothetical protein [Plantactinospora mayteni]GIG96516.1 hypothetical protein Pma05_30890 [Plantactinospora mayteni]
MTEERNPSATLDQLLDAVARTSYGELLHDEQRRRHELFRMMADSQDPMLREMGEQLRDGLARPRDLLSVPGYAETLLNGCQRLGENGPDLDKVLAEIDEISHREQEEREQTRRDDEPSPRP